MTGGEVLLLGDINIDTVGQFLNSPFRGGMDLYHGYRLQLVVQWSTPLLSCRISRKRWLYWDAWGKISGRRR